MAELFKAKSSDSDEAVLSIQLFVRFSKVGLVYVVMVKSNNHFHSYFE